MATEIAILTGAAFIAGSAFCKGAKNALQFLLYKNEKRKNKKMLHSAFEKNDKTMIKKAIVRLKDFDKKYNKEKLHKLLIDIIIKDKNLNEFNVLNLVENFDFINELYTSETHIKSRLDIALEGKLKKLESKKKEIKIRENKIAQKIAMKGQKMEKNKQKKIRRI